MSWLVQLVRCMGIGAEAVPGGVVARVVWPPIGGETVVTPSTMDVERATPCEKPSLTRLQNKTSQRGAQVSVIGARWCWFVGIARVFGGRVCGRLTGRDACALRSSLGRLRACT